MLNLEAARKRQRLEISNCRNNNTTYQRKEQRCYFDGNNFISFQVLSRLPGETLLNCKAVCRYWRYLIKHCKHFIDLHSTSSEFRLRHETKFLMYPTYSVNGTPQIKRVMFCQKDLRFDDNKGCLSSEIPVVTTDDVSLDDKPVVMLEPVHGLVCYVRGGVTKHCAVLVYNPSTGLKSPWIETSTSDVFEKISCLKPLSDLQRRRAKIFYRYMFGFGFDPATKQHKVLCIYKKVKRKSPRNESCELVCGVFTVGDNTWRNVEVPPDVPISSRWVHVCGSIYWMSCKNLRSQKGFIVVFDVGSETFRRIPIPSFILDCWDSMKLTKLVTELVEVDGCLAILVRQGDDTLNVWIYNVSGTNGGSVTDCSWINETIELPCGWNEIYNLAFKAITGTSLVVIKLRRELGYRQQFHYEVLRYYDRREKKFYGNVSNILWESAWFDRTSGFSYSITPFFDTLSPVQGIYHLEGTVAAQSSMASSSAT